ncbi:hypothetical protein [Thalassotalea montiporae]
MRRVTLLILSSLLVGCNSTPINQQSINLTVLTEYPNCEYEVLGKVKGISGISPQDYHYKKVLSQSVRTKTVRGTKEAAVSNVKKLAKGLGADAIALTSFVSQVGDIKTGRGKTVEVQKYTVTAEAIKLCEDSQSLATNQVERKLVKYLEDGSRNNALKFKKTIKLDLNSTISRKNGVRKTIAQITPKINSSGNIFGLSLGSTIAQTKQQFGVPSAVVNLSNRIQALYYGRNNTFYFKDSNLIGFSYGKWLIPLQHSNAIPFHELFDELNWRLDGKIELFSTKKDIAQALEFFTKSTTSNNYTKKANTVTTLTFADEINTPELSYINGVSIFQSAHDRNTIERIISNKSIKGIAYNINLDVGLTLKEGEASNSVDRKLGSPWIKINSTRNKEQWVYKNGLVLNFLNDGLYRGRIISTTAIRPSCKNCLFVGQKISTISHKALNTQLSNDSQFQINLDNTWLNINYENDRDAEIESINWSFL